MPPMPPIPPMPPPPAGASSLGSSTTMASVVVMSDATLAASTSAVRQTFVGSMMPACTMSQKVPSCALYPQLKSSDSSSLPTMTAPSTPAFDAIILHGTVSARIMISMPCFWSKLVVWLARAWRPLEAYSSAEPPPATIPSSTAARVALRASVTRSFFSFTSTSEAPPTLSTATPPDSLAKRSCSFSFSYSEVVEAIDSRNSSHRSSIASFPPAPSSMTVSSFEMVMLLQVPSTLKSAVSSLRPTSSEMTVPPVRTAMSCRVALRLSPKPGAFTAATCIPPRSLLTTSVARASPSTSSATMTSGF
mmetsp:Transcript_28121/g.68242  ORF Transcript_28121/g.68242 Transcript_28121/m.68242 type:complete len:305 (+) Transcript_28121:254-1168(+)